MLCACTVELRRASDYYHNTHNDASRALEEIWKSDRPRSKCLAAKQQMLGRSTKELTLVRGTNLQKILLNSGALATQIVDTIAVDAHTAGFRSRR